MSQPEEESGDGGDSQQREQQEQEEQEQEQQETETTTTPTEEDGQTSRQIGQQKRQHSPPCEEGKRKNASGSGGQQQAQKQKNPSGGLDPRPSGSASSAAPTDDAESQATTTNDHTVDESGDSESGAGHNEPGKMFVGGLSWQTSAEGLRDYFCKFGEVNECMVMRDPTTKRARGFGFITFVDPAAVEKVLAIETHELDGKRIDPKIAFPKKQQPKMVVKTKKVFIGGLSSNSTLEDIKAYFTQYGKIEDAMLMFDKSTQRHRGFGFITFDDDGVSDKVCEIHFHEINGKMVECKKAQPKEVMLPLQLNKTRAAAARNLYGLAPEQLLAYASYIPRLPVAGYGPPAPSAHHHAGMLAAAYPPTVTTATAIPASAAMAAVAAVPHHHPHHHHFAAGNGHFHPHPAAAPSAAHQFALTVASGAAGGGGPRSGGHPHSHPHQQQQQQMGAANGTATLNPRDLLAAQLVAQQQAVYEAAMTYASQLSSLAASADFSAAGPAGHYAGGPHHAMAHAAPHPHAHHVPAHPQHVQAAQFAQQQAQIAAAAIPSQQQPTAVATPTQQQHYGGAGGGGKG